jgi:hypothetical protein
MRRPPVHGPWSNLVLQRGSKCHCYLIYLFICSVGSSRHPDQIQIRIVIWFSTSYDSEMPIVSRPLPTYCQARTLPSSFHTAVHIYTTQSKFLGTSIAMYTYKLDSFYMVRASESSDYIFRTMDDVLHRQCV